MKCKKMKENVNCYGCSSSWEDECPYYAAQAAGGEGDSRSSEVSPKEGGGKPDPVCENVATVTSCDKAFGRNQQLAIGTFCMLFAISTVFVVTGVLPAEAWLSTMCNFAATILGIALGGSALVKGTSMFKKGETE